MTREQAIQALKDGKKVTHRFFASDEYIRIIHCPAKPIKLTDEKGLILGTLEEFMFYRTDKWFDTDWSEKN